MFRAGAKFPAKPNPNPDLMKKILLVDDEPNLLAALQRALRKQFELETATSGAAGLAVLQKWQDYSVVVSDMRMPEMNGVEFLARCREIAPDVVRIMLTGNADQETAIEAINQGHIFTFLHKPCTPEKLAEALTSAVVHHQLITAERELLEGTLRGSIKILTEILAMADPKSFGHAERVRNNMRQLAEVMGLKDVWQLEVAAMLANIGFVTIPPEVVIKAHAGHPLSDREKEMFQRIPAIGGSLLAQIPRMEEVSRMLIYRTKCFDGSGLPDDRVAGAAIPLGARMLKILYDLAELEGRGKSRSAALDILRGRQGWYDPQILQVVGSPLQAAALVQAGPAKPSVAIPFSQLRVGHVLTADVESRDGILIVVTGNRITHALLERLRNFYHLSGIKEPLCVEA